jgi:hypothetical protein
MRFSWADGSNNSIWDSSKRQANAGAAKRRAHGFKPLSQYYEHPKTDNQGVQVLSELFKNPKKFTDDSSSQPEKPPRSDDGLTAAIASAMVFLIRHRLSH